VSLPDDMTLWGLFVSAFFVAFSGALMPGPVMAVTITHTTRLGMKAGPLIILGHGIAETALLACLVLGLGPYLQDDVISGLIGGLGALVLLWMGIDMLRSLPGLSLEVDKACGLPGKGARPIRDGLVLSVINPYFYIWWGTIGLAFVSKSLALGIGLGGLLVFYLGHYLADFTWYALISLTVCKGRRFLSDKVYKGIVMACAILLLVFTGVFGIYAWDKLT
jgi:threonine/homoserine/homoserine lactone efflux protein